MRIVHLVKGSVNSFGGSEKYIRNLCEWSLRDGHKIDIFTNGDLTPGRPFAPHEVTLHRIPYFGLIDFISPCLVARTICSFPEEEVVIHVHGFKDVILAIRTKNLIGKRKKIKIICTRHIIRPGNPSFYWNQIYKRIDRTIFVSGIAKDVFLSSHPTVDSEKLTVIHNSIMPPAPLTTQSEGNRTDGEPTKLLFIGRIVEDKGVDILIESLKYLEGANIELTIVGDGEDELMRSLKSLAERLNVARQIKWVGYKQNVFPDINESDICVVTTTCPEAFGLVHLEYMSQEKAIISTNNGAQKEIITDGVDGLLVPPGDAKALAAAIRKLVSDPELRKRMGHTAFETFKNKFSYPVFFAKTMEVYSN